MAFGQDLKILPTIILKIFSIPIVIRTDGRFSNFVTSKLKKKLFMTMENFNYQIAEIILTENEYMIESNKLPKEKSKTLKMGISIEDSVIKNVSTRKFDIGFIGRFEIEKGIYNFIEAIKKIDGNYSIIIIGQGTEQDKVLNSLTNTNIKIYNWLNQDDLNSILGELKILVVPSYREGLPNIIIESMAKGCLVVANKVGGIPGILINEFNGFLIEDNNPNTIKEKLNHILMRNDLDNIQKNAIMTIKEQFDCNKIKMSYKEIINKI